MASGTVSPSGLSYSKWGECHNEALALAKHYWIVDTTYTYDSLIKVMRTEMATVHPEFSGITNSEIEAELTNPVFVAVINKRLSTPIEATTLFRKILSDRLHDGKISQTLHDGFYEVFNANLSYDEVIERVNNINLTVLSSEEQDMVTATKSILINSHTLWTNWEKDHPDDRALRGKWRPSNGQMGYIVDGIVGAGFFEAGPLAVLFAAAASSAWAD